MKDSEKRKFADELFPLIKEGKSFNDIKPLIEEKVKGSYTVDSIMNFLKRKVIKDFDKPFQEAYSKGGNAHLRSEFSYLDDQVFEVLLKEQSKGAFRAAQVQFNKLLREGGNRQEAAQSVINDVYKIEHAAMDAKRFDQLKAMEEASKPSYGRVIIGVILAGGGVMLSMGTNAIFYGAVFVGISMIATGLMGRN